MSGGTQSNGLSLQTGGKRSGVARSWKGGLEVGGKRGRRKRWGLLWWVSGKELACSAGDLGSIPGSGRSPGEGTGNPLQYSCLGKPMDRGAWRATVHGVAKSRTQTERLNNNNHHKRKGRDRQLRSTAQSTDCWTWGRWGARGNLGSPSTSPGQLVFPRLVHAAWPLPQLFSISQSCLSRKKKIWFSDELQPSFFLSALEKWDFTVQSRHFHEYRRRPSCQELIS